MPQDTPSISKIDGTHSLENIQTLKTCRYHLPKTSSLPKSKPFAAHSSLQSLPLPLLSIWFPPPPP
ncbi:hypothetical protein ES332_D11G242800v1 [Gossypium tomentosum]|uniref:Uncharacterized protein n=1 Tax=Gossypium tomentosum TaxID=34277 RepID=A0A5D2IRN5_GOSTO|nr:hypothetical protein ES332_D11G242800v1 [Gossypium tomentosum]